MFVSIVLTLTSSCPTVKGATASLTKLSMMLKLSWPTELDESRMKKRSRIWLAHGLLSGQEHSKLPMVLVQVCEQPPLSVKHSSISNKKLLHRYQQPQIFSTLVSRNSLGYLIATENYDIESVAVFLS